MEVTRDITAEKFRLVELQTQESLLAKQGRQTNDMAIPLQWCSIVRFVHIPDAMKLLFMARSTVRTDGVFISFRGDNAIKTKQICPDA